MDYITIKQMASKWRIGVRQVQRYCKNGQIDGVIRFNGVWAIPADAPKPIDGRRKLFETCLEHEEENLPDINDDLEVFKKIFDMFPYRLNVTNADGFMVYANEAFFMETLHKVREKTIGQYNILKEPLLKKWGLVEHIRRAFRGERVYTPALKFPNKDLVGSKYNEEFAFITLYNDISSFPIFADDGRLRYVVTVYIPVREYKAREEVVRAKEYIDAHWKESFSTKQSAHEAHLSITSLVQHFRNEVGMTPHEYYTKIRMSRLCDALCDDNFTIAQAFELCGMEYNSYYTTLFKKHIGLTPKQFREQNK